jgi:hypothetical protein
MMALAYAAPACADPAEEKAAIEKLLPKFQEAWNSGEPTEVMGLLDPDSKARQKYEKQTVTKPQVVKEFKRMMAEFGDVESFEIRKYIAAKSCYVVRVKYASKGVIAGTFAVKKNEQGVWALFDINIDGQGEPELKE